MTAQAKLRQETGPARGRVIPLSEATVLGRSETAMFRIDDAQASREHMELRPEAGGWIVMDRASTNGTFLNDTKLAPQVPTRLENGSCLRVGATEFRFSDGVEIDRPQAAIIPVSPPFTIGRGPECDLVIDTPNVSYQHCRLCRRGQGWTLEDLGSRNGTFLNGAQIALPETLRLGDEIAVGLHRFVFRADPQRGFVLEHLDQTHTVRLDVDQLHHTVQQDGKEQTLLNAVSLVIPPKEFVAIVGGSGAGKTTLLNAIAGQHRAAQGTVRLNGVDLHTHADLFRPVTGYVPQEDVVHRELRVDEALRYAAELRLPPDGDASERERLVDEALAQLEITHRKTALVSTLSGGERKRVSVAMELLSHPGLLFLDEPTSGLDPGLELKFLELVKRLAEEGRTVVMVTHSPSIMIACNKLLFMARGGRVAFYGPPQEALEFFGVEHIAEAYVLVDEDERAPEVWERRYRESVYFRQYVASPLENARPHIKGQTVTVAERLGATKPRLQAGGQLSLLARRYLDTLRRNPRYLVRLLVQAPLIATLLALVFPADLYAPSHFRSPFMTGNTSVTPASLLWTMVICALLFGVVNAGREISKESAIYQRERMVNLRPGPYLLSKVALLSVLSLQQSVLMVAILRCKIDFHLEASEYLIMTGLLMLMTLCGYLLGLLVSAYALTTAKASDRTNLAAAADNSAMSLIPVAILPPLIFSGLIDLDSLRIIGKTMPTYWAYGALGSLAHINSTMFRFLPPKEQFTTSPALAALALCGIGGFYFLCAYVFLARKR